MDTKEEAKGSSNVAIDMDKFTEHLKAALDAVKTQEDPDTMNKLKKVYKENIPWGMRSYVGAYLVKTIIEHSNTSYQAASNRAPRSVRPPVARVTTRGNTRVVRYDNYKTSEDTPPATKVSSPKDKGEKVDRLDRVDRGQNTRDRIAETRARVNEGRKQWTPEEEAILQSIFISTGRNTHTYAKDIVGLLCSVAKVERDKIGRIRLMPNYSFVQLLPDDARKAIDALNGYEYKHKPLTVSYSTQKNGEAKTALASTNIKPNNAPNSTTNGTPNSTIVDTTQDTVANETTAPIQDTSRTSSVVATTAPIVGATAPIVNEAIPNTNTIVNTPTPSTVEENAPSVAVEQ